MKKAFLSFMILIIMSSCVNNAKIESNEGLNDKCEQKFFDKQKDYYELKNFMSNVVSEYPTLIAENAIQRNGNEGVIDSIKTNIDSLVKYNTFKIYNVLGKNTKGEYIIAFELNTGDGFMRTHKINEVLLTVVGALILDDINDLEYNKYYSLVPEGNLKSIKDIKGVYTKSWGDIFYIDCGLALYPRLKANEYAE